MYDKNDPELKEKYEALKEAGLLDELLSKADAPAAAEAAAVDPDDYVVFEHVRKVYHVGEVDIEALADATFSVAKGELAIVVGESGAGKTTLLNILGGMDTLTSGRVLLDGREISSLNMRELTKYRR